MLRVRAEKLTPIRMSSRESAANGAAYCLSSICFRASSAELSNLNSMM